MALLSAKDFDYELPPERIAQQPHQPRDACRLMCLHRATGSIEDRNFRDLMELLRPADLLVLNDTRVIPAKFNVVRSTGGRMEGLFLRQLADGAWVVLLKNAGRCKVGEALRLDGCATSAAARGSRRRRAVDRPPRAARAG